MKEIVLLGATGSIGSQVIEVAKKKKISIKAIAFGKNIEKAIEIIRDFNIKYVATINDEIKLLLEKVYPKIKIVTGDIGLQSIIEDNSGDVVNAITGIKGLIPTIKALENKRDVYLANKETLVVAGELINKLCIKNNVRIIPIDSEHNAVYQLLQGKKKEEVKDIIITASGGAFLNKNRDELAKVKIEDALKHPNWSMGKKITVDCATMVNKGLEVIEAHFLFNMEYDDIKTIIHPNSIIHSMIELKDGSAQAVMYNPSMIIPIQHALLGSYEKTNIPFIDFEALSQLCFKKMDYERFPMIKLAYKVGKLGGLYPTVYNASNEIAVNLFLEGRITFLEIETIIKSAVESFVPKDNQCIDLQTILETDALIRKQILEVRK